MKFAVSNIAWSPEERLSAYATLSESQVRGLEIAPGLLFHGAEDVFVPDEMLARDRMTEISDAGLTLVSMQSLLFGVEGAALFEGDAALKRLIDGMKRAIDLANRFEIPNLVFGSPKQRVIPKGMARETALNYAVKIFQELGDYAAQAGTVVAMEANPEAYGTNFLTAAKDVAAFVKHVRHPAVRMIFDVGAMHLNDVFDDAPNFIAGHSDIISHVHISEPFLEPAPARAEDAAKVLKALQAVHYDHWISIEMKATPVDSVDQMGQAVRRLQDAADMAKATS